MRRIRLYRLQTLRCGSHWPFGDKKKPLVVMHSLVLFVRIHASDAFFSDRHSLITHSFALSNEPNHTMFTHFPLTCNAPNLVSAICCLILVIVLVCFSFKRGASYIEWAYHIGDQPIYRLLFLIAIVLAAQHRAFFPVAILLAVLFMVINSMVPMLTELDETFVFGAPLTDCGVYSAEDVKATGTAFHGMNGGAGGYGENGVDEQHRVPMGVE